MNLAPALGKSNWECRLAVSVSRDMKLTPNNTSRKQSDWRAWRVTADPNTLDNIYQSRHLKQVNQGGGARLVWCNARWAWRFARRGSYGGASIQVSAASPLCLHWQTGQAYEAPQYHIAGAVLWNARACDTGGRTESNYIDSRMFAAGRAKGRGRVGPWS